MKNCNGRYIYLGIAILLIMFSSSCSIFVQSSMVDNYKSVDDLIKDSPAIVIGTVTSGNNKFEYGDIVFGLTEFQIESSLRGEISGTIHILQTKMSEDPFIKNGDKLLLFLTRYTGPVAENAYRIKGLYLGQYKIIGEEIIKQKNNELTGTEFLANVDLCRNRIQTIGYDPVLVPTSSQE
jgi:hypothetical protein